jgi:hypothetical protein
MTAMLSAQFTGLMTDSTELSRRAAERHAVLTAIKASRSRDTARHRDQLPQGLTSTHTHPAGPAPAHIVTAEPR